MVVAASDVEDSDSDSVRVTVEKVVGWLEVSSVAEELDVASASEVVEAAEEEVSAAEDVVSAAEDEV